MIKAGVTPLFALVLFLTGTATAFAVPPPRDRTPPVISNLHAELITTNSVLIVWTTDEPADSDIKYGISPKTNINGPGDSTLVLSHTIALSGLVAATGYDFCVESRDAANNKAQACGTFTTLAVPPPDTTAPVITAHADINVQAPDAGGVIVSYTLPTATDNVDGPVAVSCTPASDSLFALGSTVVTCTAHDAASNTAASHFTVGVSLTPPPPPPPPPPTPVSIGSGGGARPSYAYVSGFAYPGALISVALRALFSGTDLVKETTAESDGSFSAAFSSFPQGAYFFTVTAKDSTGASSARKGFQFDFSSGDAPLTKEKIIMPPTLWPARETIAWGDNLQVFGNTVPRSGVLVEAGGVLYETKSDDTGLYNILINTARFAPGKLSIRARSSLISAFGYDYSPSKTVVLTLSSVPKADLNGDGKVDMVDFSIFLSKPADLNGDGKVNAADVSVFLKAFSGMSR